MNTLQLLTSFPASGLNSISGYTAPVNSGSVAITEVRNILDTRWATDAMNQAATLAKASNSTAIIPTNCLTSNGISNVTASLFGMSSDGSFDLAGLGKLLGAGTGSLATLIGDLQIAATLQSLIAGLARSISNTAGAVFALLERALGMSDGSSLISLASGLVSAAGRAVDLFSNAFQMTLGGGLGMGGINPGELISGAVTMIGTLVGGTLVGAAVLAGGAVALAAGLAAYGISALIPPTSSFSALSSLMPSVSGASFGGLSGFGSAMSSLNAATLSQIASKIGSALSGLFTDPGNIQSLVNGVFGATNTFDRNQGISFIDGDWQGTALSVIAGLGMAALLWQLTKKSKSGTLAAGSATAILLASLLGNSAPVSSSFLGATNGSWLGSPAAALNGTSGALAEACAYNAALQAALGQISTASTSSIDSLMSSLECRRSTYDSLYTSASASALNSQDLLSKLLSLLGVMNGVSYPSICPDSGYSLGACS